jgi:hypothetical protein
MPYVACGFRRTDQLVVPTVGTFNLAVDDYEMSLGTEGSKNIQVKLGSFVDQVATYRPEVTITLESVPRPTYDSLKNYCTLQLLNSYLPSYEGNVTIDIGGEFFEDAIIKSVTPEGSAVRYPNPSGNPLDPDVEVLDKVKIKLYSKEYRLF